MKGLAAVVYVLGTILLILGLYQLIFGSPGVSNVLQQTASINTAIAFMTGAACFYILGGTLAVVSAMKNMNFEIKN